MTMNSMKMNQQTRTTNAPFSQPPFLMHSRFSVPSTTFIPQVNMYPSLNVLLLILRQHIICRHSNKTLHIPGTLIWCLLFHHLHTICKLNITILLILEIHYWLHFCKQFRLLRICNRHKEATRHSLYNKEHNLVVQSKCIATYPNSSNNMDSHILKPSVVPPSVNLQPSYHPNDNIDKKQNNGKNTSRKSSYF